jgi:hypothetical protein
MWQTKFHTHTKQMHALSQLILLLISSCIQSWRVRVGPKYLNFATSSKGLFSISMLCFVLPSGMVSQIFLVLSGFTSRPTSLPASNRASVFFPYGICVFSHYININSTGQKRWSHSISVLLGCLKTLLMAYSKATLKINSKGNRKRVIKLCSQC